jgi:hypothetical protein
MVLNPVLLPLFPQYFFLSLSVSIAHIDFSSVLFVAVLYTFCSLSKCEYTVFSCWVVYRLLFPSYNMCHGGLNEFMRPESHVIHHISHAKLERVGLGCGFIIVYNCILLFNTIIHISLTTVKKT